MGFEPPLWTPLDPMDEGRDQDDTGISNPPRKRDGFSVTLDCLRRNTEESANLFITRENSIKLNIHKSACFG